jgi:uncharacterized SAM-binding protein YcdF (DUF218 family)
LNRFLDIILGISLIFYIIVINSVSNARIAFSQPILILGIIFIIYHFVKGKIKENKFLFKEYRIIKVLMCIGLICFLGIEAIIISYPKYNKEKADYILVLGAGLSGKTAPSRILEDRLNATLRYINENDTGYIVLSGGQGEDEDLPEALVMSKYLQERGVSKERIIIEDKSRNTNENFKFSKLKIEEHSHKSLDKVSVKVITTDFHAFRSSILAKKNGYVKFQNYSSSTAWYLIPITYTREAFAIVKSILFD